jgi:DNA-directed RNA polymerase subunit RPC12/RpoP
MYVTFNCSNCRQSLEIDESGAGASIDCPKCGKPVYVPSRAVASPTELPTRVAVKPKQHSTATGASSANRSSLPPSIEGGLHCVVVAAVLLIIGLFLFRSGLVVGMICFAVAIPFQIAALLCAVYAICNGSIKHGLALVVGVAVLCALIMVGPLWLQARTVTDMQKLMEEQQKQMEQMLKQFRR